MGKTPTGDRKYQIESVWVQHKEIARRLVLGEKHVVIARDMNISVVMVSYTANSHLVQKEMAILMAKRDGITVDIANDIQDLAPLALQKMGEMLAKGTEKDSDMIKLGFAVLDRAGFSPVKRTININGTLSKEDIEDLKERGREKLAASTSYKGNGVEEAEVISQ